MAGIANFKGKKAAPFVKGGKRRKAVLVRNRAKTRKGGADLAFRYRHGWVKIGDEAPKKGTFFHGPKSANSSNAGGGTYKNTREGALRSAKLAAKNAQKKRAQVRAQRNLATPATGSEIDLDWSAWNAAHKGQSRPGAQRTRTATKSGASFSEIKNFKKSAGLKGGGLGPKAQTALEARAAAPGDHFRAKAILAAQSGNKALAAKYTAQMVAKRARELKARGSKAKPFNPAPRRGVSLSNTDLSVLTAAERDALPASAFVFPGRRAYPIHDKAHARNALARSAGKPEHAAVVAAVRARYPGLGA